MTFYQRLSLLVPLIFSGVTGAAEPIFLQVAQAKALGIETMLVGAIPSAGEAWRAVQRVGRGRGLGLGGGKDRRT